MRVNKAIVDKLPKSTLECDFGIHEWNCNLGEVVVTCELRPHEQVSMDKLSFITLRCFDCPLEEVQE